MNESVKVVDKIRPLEPSGASTIERDEAEGATIVAESRASSPPPSHVHGSSGREEGEGEESEAPSSPSDTTLKVTTISPLQVGNCFSNPDLQVA